MRRTIVKKTRGRPKPSRKSQAKRRTIRHTRGRRVRQRASGPNTKKFIIRADLGSESVFNWTDVIKPALDSNQFSGRMEKYLMKLTRLPKVTVSTVSVFDAGGGDLISVVDYDTAGIIIPVKRLQEVALDALNYLQTKMKLTEHFYPARFEDDQDDPRFQEDDITVEMPKMVEALPAEKARANVPVEYFIDAGTNLKMARVPRGTLLYRGERAAQRSEEQLLNAKYGTFLAGSKEDVMMYAQQQLDIFEVVNDIDLLVFSQENMHRLIELNPNTNLAKLISFVTGIDSATVYCSPTLVKPPKDMIYCPANQDGEYMAMSFGIALNQAGFNGWYVPPNTVSQVYTQPSRVSSIVRFLPEEILLFNNSRFLRVRELIKFK